MSWNATQQILLTISPFIGLGLAYSGLSTWRRQLEGTHDFELGRRLLIALYQMREALQATRNPFLQPGEASDGREDWDASAYENRWKAVTNARTEISTAALESEATWGEPFKEELTKLHKLTVELLIAVQHYLASQGNRGREGLFTEKDEAVLWGREDDDFAQRLDAVVAEFETKLKPKLGRK